MIRAKSIYPSRHIGPRRASKSTLWRDGRRGRVGRDAGQVKKTARPSWLIGFQARLDQGCVGLCVATDELDAGD